MIRTVKEDERTVHNENQRGFSTRKGYFAADMLQRIIVHKECSGLAEYINCRNLSDIYYDDIDYYENLTADDT